MRKILRGAVGVGLAGWGGTPAVAEPAEPLVVTRLADPDPNFVPSPEPRHGRHDSASDVGDPVLDAAVADFGRALGQAMQLQQQAFDQRCKSSEAASATGMDRIAWEAACKYTRR